MWSAPRNWAAGEVITAVIMNTDVRDQFRYLKGLDGDTTLNAGLTVSSGIANTNLKVATGVASTYMWSGDTLGVALEDWSFSPNFFNSDSQKLPIQSSNTSAATTVARFAIGQAPTSTTFVVRYRYLTASGPPDIRVGLDASGNICAVAAAPDPLPDNPIGMERITQYLQFKPSIQVYKAIASEGEVASRILQSGLIVSGTALQMGEQILEGKLIS